MPDNLPFPDLPFDSDEEMEDVDPALVNKKWMRLAGNMPNGPLPQAPVGLRNFHEGHT